MCQVDKSLQQIGVEPGELRGTLRLGVIPYLDFALMPKLLGLFSEEYPAVDLSILEISSTDVERLLEDGRMDVGLGWVTHHSPNLHYKHFCDDRFTVVVAEGHPWSRRRAVDLSELHLQRVLQLPDTYVMRRITDEMFRNYRIRPRTVAEINSIETLLRSLGPLKAMALMPRISPRDAGNLGLKSIRLEGRDLGLEVGLLRLIDSGTNSAVAAFSRLGEGCRSGAGRAIGSRKRRSLGRSFDVLRFFGDQVTQGTQGRKVLRDQFLVFHPNAAIAFHERNQTNQTERVDLQRLVGIGNRRQRSPAFIDVVLKFLRCFHA
ncbi:MAG: LysR family transcriptional regulator substrate-binding protein [Chthoniobacterales bacterium]